MKLLSDEAVRKLMRIIHKLDSANGPGVNNHPNLLTIGQQTARGRRTPAQPLPNEWWAEITALSNDTLSVRPVRDVAGTGGGVTAYGSIVPINKPDKLLHDASQYPLVENLSTTNTNEVDVDDDTGGGATNEETWIVTPVYAVGDLVLVAKKRGRNGWWDNNNDGRAWAVKAS